MAKVKGNKIYVDRNEYVYEVDFKEGIIDYTYKENTYNVGHGDTKGIWATAFSKNRKNTLSWENDMYNAFLDNFKGTDMKYIKNIVLR
jgi:hypothetical protein